MNINFYNIEEAQLLSYHFFVAQVNNNNLKELNGYKIRNILSLVFNSKIKDFILEDLFNENGSFLSSDTKQELFRYLSLDERNDLKIYLSNYLDYQIDSKWYNSLTEFLNKKSINTIVISTQILNHDLIFDLLKTLFPKKKFVDWLSFNEKSNSLVLDYNHAWKKQNIFTINEFSSYAYFLKHFFENTYLWKAYNDDRHLFNRMNTQTRELLIGKEVISEIKEKLTSFRPQKSLNEWDILHESEHKNSFNPQEEIIIHFNSTNSYRYRFSSSFLLEKDKKFYIKSAKELMINTDSLEGKFLFSNLENIITQIDLSKLNKAIEKDESIFQIIQPLWEKFNLNEHDGRLWKQLLQSKAKEYGVENVFNEIESVSGIKQFVSLNTFENAYCNPENNTIIPREKKVFKAICKYLGLPLEYRAAMHRERNLIGGHSQELHSKLKELIKAIVEYGILDKHINDDALLDILTFSIDKIEKRVDMDFFGFTKDSLNYACIQICYEIIEKMKLKPIHKIEHIVPN
ncbi:hypothetical protein [Flavobacterium sp.]|uniref:hypothetical protein n=1 Tax=Flavobacterium sp. TaxID=239 RepID=UPI003D27481D